MKDLTLTIGGSSFPTPKAIQHILKLDTKDKFGIPLLIFGLQVLITVTIALALVFLIWGGISWIMSEGDKAKLQAARNTVIFSIIGLIISLLSFVIVNIVGYFLLGPNVNIFG